MPDAAATVPALSARRRNRFGLSVPVVIAAVIVLVIAVCTILGPLIAPQDPGAQDLLLSASPPTSGHLFGTDQLGRDVFSRIIVGARLSFTDIHRFPRPNGSTERSISIRDVSSAGN